MLRIGLTVVIAICAGCAPANKATPTESPKPIPPMVRSDGSIVKLPPGLVLDPQALPATENPEDVVRKFMIGWMSLDIAAIRQYAIPHDDLAILWDDSRTPVDMRLSFIERARRAPIVQMHAGEVYRYTADRYVILDPHDERIFRAYRMELDSSELLIFLWRHRGQWRVDAGQWIVSRQAANRLRRARESTQP